MGNLIKNFEIKLKIFDKVKKISNLVIDMPLIILAADLLI